MSTTVYLITQYNIDPCAQSYTFEHDEYSREAAVQYFRLPGNSGRWMQERSPWTLAAASSAYPLKKVDPRTFNSSRWTRVTKCVFNRFIRRHKLVDVTIKTQESTS